MKRKKDFKIGDYIIGKENYFPKVAKQIKEIAGDDIICECGDENEIRFIRKATKKEIAQSQLLENTNL